MTPAVFEGKYELDSLVAFLKLGNAYWSRARAEDSRRCLQPTAASREGPSGSDDWFLRTVWVVLETLRVQQRGSEEDSMHPVQYAFWRSENDLGNNGTGYPSRRTGMIKSAFRPSDDPTTFPFNIPSNWFAVTELRRLNATLTEMGGKGMREAAAEAASIAEDVARGIEAFGSAANPANALEKILVYETDGFGNTLFMDDANAPSVLSIPYLSPEGAQSPIFAASRAFSLSPCNPFYFRGKVGSGVGGPHVGMGWIWPLSIIYSLFYAEASDAEISRGLDLLRESTAGTNCMHESFWKDDAANFTRAWFAWANSVFGELIMHLIDTRPHLILR